MKPTHSKIILGPGGVRCPCCRPRGSTTHETKKALARVVRRAARLALKREARDGGA